MNLCVTSKTIYLVNRVCELKRVDAPFTYLVYFIGEQMTKPISSLPSSEIRGERILDKVFLQVTAVCKSYFNAQIADSKDVLTECANVIIAKYPFLSLDEIGEAFRMAVSNQIKGVSFATYNGVLTVPVFIDVLTKYIALRKEVASLIKQANELGEKEEYDKEKERLMSELADKNIAVKFEADKLEFPYKDRFDIPDYLGRCIVKLGLIWIGQSVKDAIWEDAKQLAPDDLQRLKALHMENIPSGEIGTHAKRTILQRYENTPENIRERAKIIYSQLIYQKACNGLIYYGTHYKHQIL